MHYFSASGYISDPQFVYKRTEDDVQSPPSSEEQKEAYKIIQKGGEIPLKGLRKPAPERPKGMIYVKIKSGMFSTGGGINYFKKQFLDVKNY